jgi:hypothetical protein
MQRYLAKVIAHDGQKTTSPILHFEGYTDAQLIFEIMNNCPDDIETLKRSIIWKFSEGKDKAINNHKSALNMGHNISTLVDMDHDINNRSFALKKKSAERIPRIHSTKPACTLITAIFIENGKFDQVTFSEAIRTIPDLSSTDEETLDEIKKNAVRKTWESFTKSKGHAVERYIKPLFIKKKIPLPLNDHALIEAIHEKCENITEKVVEKKMKEYFLNNHERVFVLLTPIISKFLE